MATLYAWSDIRVGEPAKDDKPGKLTTIKFGEAVTAEKLGGADKEQMQAYMDSGAIREIKPPDMPDTWQGSPLDFVRSEAEKADNNMEFLPHTGGSAFAPEAGQVLLGEATLDAKAVMPADEGSKK